MFLFNSPDKNKSMWDKNYFVASVSSEAFDSPGSLSARLHFTFRMGVKATGRNFNFAVSKMIRC